MRITPILGETGASVTEQVRPVGPRSCGAFPRGIGSAGASPYRASLRIGGIMLAIVLALGAGAASAAPAPAGDPVGGQSLAQRLRSAMPEEASEIRGTLIIGPGKHARQVPVVCRVILHDGTWETDYDTAATACSGAERLMIIHRPNAPNEYLYAKAAAPDAALPPPAPLAPADADIPLAGSDFSLADLGLEFLHWPDQREFPDETRLDRACYVLESRNPQGSGITRVRSYFDKESGGLLIAEAFDAGGQAAKKFSLHGSSFKKVNGHYRLEKMEISNRKTRSQTELKFDISP